MKASSLPLRNIFYVDSPLMTDAREDAGFSLLDR